MVSSILLIGRLTLERSYFFPRDSIGEYLDKFGRTFEGAHNLIIYILLIKKKRACYMLRIRNQGVEHMSWKKN